jgi:hypothetical protein
MIGVNVPEPAISGKAMGTNVAARTSFSLLKSSKPITFPGQSKNYDRACNGKRPYINTQEVNEGFANKKNKIIRAPETSVALNSLILPNVVFNEMRTGTAPTISITANSVRLTVSRFLNLISMSLVYANLKNLLAAVPRPVQREM